MPYRISPDDSTCVQVERDGSWVTEKCHESAEDARAHLAALEINVDKEDISVFKKFLKLVGASVADFQEPQEPRSEVTKSEDGRMEIHSKILKTDATRQIAYGVVLEPTTKDNRDAHGHWYTAEDIYDAMVNYHMKTFKAHTDQHKELVEGVRIIESAQAPTDFEWEGPDGEKQVVKAGTWYMGVYYPDELWKQIEKGEKTGLSIGGSARVIPDA